MNSLKKLGLPADIAPTLDLLVRIANGENFEYDIVTVTRNISLVQYYLKGKVDGMTIRDGDKETATSLITDASNELRTILDIITDTE